MFLPPQWNKAAKAFHGAGREQEGYGTDGSDSNEAGGECRFLSLVGIGCDPRVFMVKCL